MSGLGAALRHLYRTRCRYLWMVLVLAVLDVPGSIVVVGAGGGHGASSVSLSELPLQTSGRYVVGRGGERVKLACINWYGAHSGTFVPGGLEVQPLHGIVSRIVDLGFNCVRLPYSTQAEMHNPEVEPEFVAANPQFRGAHFSDVYDATVEALTGAGLMVIINNQNHKAGWCCYYKQDEGLWYVPGYPEDTWIQSLVNLTQRFRQNKLVIGMDLRNEVHDHGTTRLTWGDGDSSTDWAAAATRAGNAVLANNPDSLIIVNGLCFGMDLRSVREAPIVLSQARRVIYEAHNYLEFNIPEAFSEVFMSWGHIRLLSGLLGLACLVSMVLMRRAWRAVGKPKPSPRAAIATCGLWWFVLFAIMLALTYVSIWQVRKLPSCNWWVQHDMLPAVSLLSVLAALGIVVLLAAAAWPVPAARPPQLALPALAGPGAGTAPGGAVESRGASEPGSSPHARAASAAELGGCGSSAHCGAAAAADGPKEMPAAGEASVGDASGLASSPGSVAEEDDPSSGLLGAPGSTSLRTILEHWRSRGCESRLRGLRKAVAGQKHRPGIAVSIAVHLDVEAFGADTVGSRGAAEAREVPLRLAIWDRGLCCGLQVFCGCGLLLLIVGFLFVFSLIAPSYALAKWTYDSQFGFLLEEGYEYTAPVWVGEFGATVSGTYWTNFVRYMSDRDLDFAYWAINGRKWSTGYIDTMAGGKWVDLPPHWANESFGLLEPDYHTVRDPSKMLDLHMLQASPAEWRPRARPCDRRVLGPACGG